MDLQELQDDRRSDLRFGEITLKNNRLCIRNHQ